MEPKGLNSEKQLRVLRGRVDSVNLYEVKENELEILENGEPTGIYLNFSIFLLSLAFSAIIALCTATFNNNIIQNAFGSATPAGIMKLIEQYNLPIEGKQAVVIGRSPILGKPIAMMLLNKNATVTICHSKTKNLSDIVKQADIVVGAVGIPEFIKADWIKDNAIVIDAGYHKGGFGDIEVNKAKDRTLAYTPVPGGVGPITIATLISQTVESAEERLN